LQVVVEQVMVKAVVAVQVVYLPILLNR